MKKIIVKWVECSPEKTKAWGYKKEMIVMYSNHERFSAGITGGVALNLGINTKLDFRYSRDFTTSYDMGQTDLKNQNFSISVQQTLFRKQAK